VIHSDGLVPYALSNSKRQFMRDRRPGAMKPISAEQAPREFEEGYAKYMLWRKATPMTAEEVSSKVRNRAQKSDKQQTIKVGKS